MYEHLKLRQDGDVVWATMNRPERLNALNRKLVEELRDFFVGLYWRRDVRVVVLCGAGGDTAKMLVDSQLAEHVGERNVQPDLAAALTRAQELLRTDSV